MALFSIGSNFVRIIAAPSQPILKQSLCRSNVGCLFPMLSSNITCKAFREKDPDIPPPFPYKEKYYTFLRSMIDRTTHRFDENSKIIVVDGPIASGKSAVAKELAEDLDMYHIPEANMDIRYISPTGYDLRKLDSKLPETVQSFDEKKFCMDPYQLNVAAFQLWMYRLRYSLYIDALAHVLSTGQGVVIERCPWSDMVFMEAMTSQKYMTKEARKAYYEVKKNTIDELMRPHLVVYLDVPVDKVMEKIHNRNLSHEINGKALSKAYLQDLENVYKTEYLKEISRHAELLIYDWSEEGDVEVVVEDIERIDFDRFSKHDEKLKDWRKFKEQDWADTRMKYADEKEQLMALFNVPALNAPELIADGEATKAWYEAWQSAPGMEFAKGFNPFAGDTSLLFKTKGEKYVPF